MTSEFVSEFSHFSRNRVNFAGIEYLSSELTIFCQKYVGIVGGGGAIMDRGNYGHGGAIMDKSKLVPKFRLLNNETFMVIIVTTY